LKLTQELRNVAAILSHSDELLCLGLKLGLAFYFRRENLPPGQVGKLRPAVMSSSPLDQGDSKFPSCCFASSRNVMWQHSEFQLLSSKKFGGTKFEDLEDFMRASA
jgi:hypothetical protein